MATKRALIVGINGYKGSPLYGCVNDANAMRAVLIELYGFSNANIRVLCDRDATSDAIKQRIQALVSDATSGDTVVFFFAGHGTQVGVGVGDEVDGKNEAIVPYDMSYASLITDDYIYQNLVSPFAGKEASLTAIFDCCHSGTILRDLIYDVNGVPFVEVLNRTLPAWFLRDEEAVTRDVAILPVSGLSACKDEETAADLKRVGPRGVPRGAFSYALHKMLGDKQAITYGEIEASIGAAVRAVSPKHVQNPQVSPTDPGRPIFT